MVKNVKLFILISKIGKLQTVIEIIVIFSIFRKKLKNTYCN